MVERFQKKCQTLLINEKITSERSELGDW